MRRGLIVLVLFSVLFSSFASIPSVVITDCSNSVSSGSADQLDNSTIKESNFTISADGDVSSESVTLFSETSNDDVFLYPDSDTGGSSQYSSMFTTDESIDSDVPLDPDSDTNGDVVYSEWGSGESVADDVMLYPDGIETTMDLEDGNSYVEDFSDVSDFTLAAHGSNGYGIDTNGSVMEMWITPVDPSSTDFVRYEDVLSNTMTIPDDAHYLVIRYALEYPSGTRLRIHFVDSTGSIWANVFTSTGSESPNVFYTVTKDISSFSSNTLGRMSVYLYDNPISLASGNYSAYVDWVVISDNIVQSDTDVYTESFADVSDWNEFYAYNMQSGDYSISTDGDVATISANFDDSANEYVRYVVNVSSIGLGLDDYLEFRYRVSSSDIVSRVRIIDSGGTERTITACENLASTSWATIRVRIGSFSSIAAGSIQKIRIYADDSSNGVASGWNYVYFDYLRIAPADQMGWQYDGSTTAGTEPQSTDVTYSASSDGDILTTVSTYNGVAAWAGTRVYFDTTSTQADLERDYYPFAAVRVRASWSAGTSGIGIWFQYDGYGYARYFEAVENNTWVTLRVNVKAATTARSYKYFWFYGRVDSAGEWLKFEIDWVKVYSMINWTYDTAATNNLETAVAYYDDTENALVLEKEFDSSLDYMSIKTENTSIGYATTNMVVLVTAKASVNNSVRLRLYAVYDGASDTASYAYLHDYWETFTFSLSSTSNTLKYFKLYLRELSSSSLTGTYKIFIKDNITIRPSWYDASYDSYEDQMSYDTKSGLLDGEYGGAYHDGVWEQWIIPNDSENEYSKYTTSYMNLPGNDWWVGIRYKVEDSSKIKITSIVYDVSNNLEYVMKDETNSEWQESWLYVGSTSLSNIKRVVVYANDYPDSVDSGNWSIYMDWLVISKSPHIVPDSYSESFASISDWIINTGTESMTTNGDVANITTWTAGAGPDISFTSKTFDYVEIRYKCDGRGGFGLDLYYDGAWHDNVIILYYSDTSWMTKKTYVGEEVTQIRFRAWGSSARSVLVDYLRGGPSNYFGWQHDCSMIGGIRGIDDQSDWNVDVTSDGDVLTFNMTRVGTGSDYWCDIRFPIEAAGSGTGTDDNDIERDYYEFFAWKVRFVSFTSDFVLFYAQVDGAQPAAGQTDYIYSTNAVNDGEWHILRYNMKIYSSTTTAKQFRWYFYGNNVGDNIIVQIDWVKAYTLINWTYSDTATNNKHTAVAYYDDSESSLVLEKKFDSSDDYLALSNDLLDDNDYIPLYVKATIKASANGVCLVGLKRGSGTEDIRSLTTSWQTLKFVLFDASGYIYLYLRDADSSSGTYRIYIKDIVAYDCDPDGMDNYYSESFADVSDWSAYSLESEDSFGTDGDVGYVNVYGNADIDYNGIKTDSPSVPAGYYVEARVRINATGSDLFYLRVYEDDGLSGTNTWLGFDRGKTTWQTMKKYVSHPIESVLFYMRCDSGEHYRIEIDYIRIAPADSMGWQHDGSTTAGTSNEGSAGWTYSLSSDGDVLTITMSHDSGTDTASWVDIEFDTTSTVADLERDYYPFAAMQWSITSMSTTSGSSRVAVYPYVDGYAPNSPDEYFSHQSEYSIFDWKTSRTNLKAMTWATTSANGIRFWFYSYDAGESVTIKVDWVKVYSIANYTITQSGDTLTDYVLYCQDGNLIREGDEENNVWISLKSDFTISVDTSVYNVVNVTWDGSMTDGVVDWGFRDDYYGVWHFDEYDPDYVSDTYKYEGYRFTTTRDTITRFILNVYHECRISAIKFWTDNTAPSIQEKWQVPDEPTISDDLKLFVIAEESVSIYQVSVSVLQAPVGFTLDSLQLSRLSDDGVTEFWSGTISSNLLEGDYVLRIDVTDGANSDYGYIVFTVTRDSYTGYIRIFDSLGDYIPFETFEVWRNGSRQYTDTFSAYADEAYQITVKDRFGQTLNTTTFAMGTREFVLVVDVYSLKVMSWYSDFVRFNVTRGGVTYSEIITPLEVMNFRLYSNTYDYAIDYLNGTSISGNINLTNSTAIIVTGSTISDVYALTTNVYQMTNHINITTTTTSNNVYTIQLMFDWTNTTLYNQTVSIIAAFNWDNTTLYNQTITLGALFNSTNTVLYNQIVLIQNMFNWQNTTLYNQTISILNQLSNVNSTLYSQTVSILANISNVNSTIYGQTVTILNNLANVNSTLYSQTLQILTNISNVNTTLYGQTVSILSDIVNVNSTLYSQTLQILTNVSNVNSTIYSQTVTILDNINNVNSTLYSQTLDILSEIYNTNSTLYSQTVSILSDISNTNSTLYNQTIDIISKVRNVNSTIYNQILTVLDNLDDLNATIYMTDDPSNLHPIVLGNTMSDEYCDFVIVTNWHNTTISIYDNDVLQVSGVSELVMPIRYELLQTYGVHNLSVYVDGGADSFWYNISYAFYANQGYGESVVTLYNSRGTGFDPSAYVLYVNGTRYADWTFYDRTNAVYNITITDYFGRVIYSGMHNYSRYIDIGVSFYTFKVYSQMSEEFVYFNLTAPNGARYSQHIGPGEVVTYYLVSGTYYYAFTRTNGPNEDLYSGQITLNADSSFIITDVSLKEILVAVQQDISARPNLEPMMSSIDSVMSSINMLQTSMWLFGAVIIGIMVISVYAKDSETVKSLSTRARGKKRKGEVPEQLKPYVFKPGPENPNYRGYVSKDKLKDWREYYES